jgi:hypothetical protein
MDNPEKLATYGTQDTGQINVRKYQRGNQKWTIQRNWQHFDCLFGIPYRLFVLCLVYPMLSESLDCPFFIASLVFPIVYLSCVLCTICCQFLWIVHFWLPLWYSLTFICPVSGVPYVARIPGLSIFDCLFGIPQHRVHKTQDK